MLQPHDRDRFGTESVSRGGFAPVVRSSRGVLRPVGTQMPDGCDDSVIRRLRDEWRLVGVNWRDRRKEPQRERAIISEHGQHTTVHVLSSKRATQAFLSACGSD